MEWTCLPPRVARVFSFPSPTFSTTTFCPLLLPYPQSKTQTLHKVALRSFSYDDVGNARFLFLLVFFLHFVKQVSLSVSETQNLICDDILKLSNDLPKLLPVLAPGPEPHAAGVSPLTPEALTPDSECLSSLCPSP